MIIDLFIHFHHLMNKRGQERLAGRFSCLAVRKERDKLIL